MRITSKGFTLIELMVTIAIIAILASIGYSVFGNAQKRARISRRIQDLNGLKAALETYKAGTGSYPNSVSSGAFSCINNFTQLVPNYIITIPNDPLDGTGVTTNCYQYKTNANNSGSEYKLRTNTTISSSNEMSSNDFKTQPTLIDPALDGGIDCTVSTSGIVTGWAVYSGSNVCDDTT